MKGQWAITIILQSNRINYGYLMTIKWLMRGYDDYKGVGVSFTE